MDRTTYSMMGNHELIEFALLRDTRSELETELAQRFWLALDMIEEEDDDS